LISADDTKFLDEAKDNLSKIIPKKNSLNIEGGNFTTVFEYGVKSHFEIQTCITNSHSSSILQLVIW